MSADVNAKFFMPSFGLTAIVLAPSDIFEGIHAYLKMLGNLTDLPLLQNSSFLQESLQELMSLPIHINPFVIIKLLYMDATVRYISPLT